MELKIMPSFKDLTGQRFGRLFVLSTFKEPRATYCAIVCHCHCDCGQETIVMADNLRSGNTRSCGCLHTELRHMISDDLTGKQFGRLLVLAYAGSRRMGGQGQCKVEWRCQCICGEECLVEAGHLRSGSTQSCGCFARESFKTIPHHRTHGKSSHPLYVVWKHMMGRCYDIENNSYKDYGGRGIIVEERWHHFEHFYDDLLLLYIQGLFLERSNNNGPYAKDNCLFVSRIEQARNRRNTIILTLKDKTQTLSAWAEEIGIAYWTLRARYRAGWSAEKILLTSVRVWPEKKTPRKSKRYAFLRAAPVNDFDRTQWESMKKSYNFCCAYCQRELPLTQDHLVPLSHGGSHTQLNIVPACQKCNGQKGKKSLEDFLAQYDYILSVHFIASACS